MLKAGGWRLKVNSDALSASSFQHSAFSTEPSR